MTVFFHEWRRGIKSLLIWTVAIAAFLFLMVFLYPQMEQSMGEIEEMFKDMGSFTKAFGLNELNMGTHLGYYGVEGGNILGIGGALFAAILGITMLSKEEAEHSAEFLLTLPHSRGSIFFQKLLALITQIIFFHVLLAATGFGSLLFIVAENFLKPFLLFHLGQFLCTLQIGLLCFGLSAFFRKNLLGVGIGISLIMYFMNLMINITDTVDELRFITPFYFADAAKIIPDETFLVQECLMTFSIAFLIGVLSYLYYKRKDIHV